VGKISMDKVTRGVMPFMIAQLVLLFLMVMFPQIVIWPARFFAG
jgi:TRAP-type transport system large permease protein